MRVQDVAKSIMKLSGVTQGDLAEKFGKAGQSTISMILNGRSMKVESLLQILDVCGYELIAKSKDGKRPEYLIGEASGEQIRSANYDEERIRAIVEEVVARKMKEYRALDRKTAKKNAKECEEPACDTSEEVPGTIEFEL